MKEDVRCTNFPASIRRLIDAMMAAIHDHGHTQWGAVKLLSPAEHAIFKVEDGTMTTAGRKVFAAGDVVAVGHDLIHQMGHVGLVADDSLCGHRLTGMLREDHLDRCGPHGLDFVGSAFSIEFPSSIPA